MVKSPLIERNCKVPLIKNSNENQLAFFNSFEKKSSTWPCKEQNIYLHDSLLSFDAGS